MSGPELDELEALLAQVRRARGFDFTGYRRTSLFRRVYKRLDALGLGRISEYRKYIEAHGDELERLVGALLISTTGFFRDAEAWHTLAHRVFTHWRHRTTPIRIWCAGCASGDEVWTTAILLNEILGEAEYVKRVSLIATDIDDAALERVRAARYGEAELIDVPERYRARYFEPDAAGYVVRTGLRKPVEVALHDLLHEPLIPSLDLVICRNTMIYFTLDAQMKLLSQLHRVLDARGHLFLGSTELAVTRMRLFHPVDLRARIFAKVSQLPLRYPRSAVKSAAVNRSAHRVHSVMRNADEISHILGHQRASQVAQAVDRTHNNQSSRS